MSQAPRSRLFGVDDFNAVIEVELVGDSNNMEHTEDDDIDSFNKEMYCALSDTSLHLFPRADLCCSPAGR